METGILLKVCEQILIEEFYHHRQLVLGRVRPGPVYIGLPSDVR